MDDHRKLFDSIEEKWRHLTIKNDFVFCKAMLDEDLCRQVLEAILGVSIDRVEYVHRQEILDTAPDAKSIKLDVYIRDEDGTVYDVEMQTADTRELPQRSRFYQSMMTIEQIGKGERYSQLKDSLVIFVCDFDLFGLDKRVYSFENRCEGKPDLTLGDGAKTIFLSATAPKAESSGNALDEFLDYVACGEVSGELSAKLDSAVAKVLDNRQWRLEFMLLEVRDQANYDKGVLEGRIIGEQIGRLAGIAEGEALGREAGLAEGERLGREAGLAEGQKLGHEAGFAEGESKLASLLAQLSQLGRTEDLERAITDASYRVALYSEFGLA